MSFPLKYLSNGLCSEIFYIIKTLAESFVSKFPFKKIDGKDYKGVLFVNESKEIMQL